METKRKRGISLEKQFAQWMKSDLGYNKTSLRIPVTGRISERAYEVDICAVKFSRTWDFTRRLGYILIAISIIAYILPSEMEPVRKLMESIVASIDPSLAGSAMLIFGIAAIIAASLGKSKSKRYAWVECKDTKSNVKRAQVQKLISSVQDVRDKDDAKWKPHIIMMVAGSDFDADAKNFARENSIICYRRSNDSFKKIEL